MLNGRSFWALPEETLLRELTVTREGLSAAEAERRQVLAIRGVMFFERVVDFGLEGKFGPHLEARGRPRGTEGFEIERIGHGQHQGRVLDADGHGAGLAEEPGRQPLGLGRHRRRPGNGCDGQLQLFGERTQYVSLRNETEVHEDAAKLVATLFLEFQCAVEFVGAQKAARLEDLAEAHTTPPAPARRR